MKETNLQNEYLFLLGAGASAASACPIMRKLFGVPIWGKFVDLLRRIHAMDEVELSRIIDDCYLDRPYNQHTQRVIDISDEKGITDVSVLIKALAEEKSRVGLRINEMPAERTLIHEYIQIISDIDKVVGVILGTIAAYYSHFDSEYYLRLWRIVMETNSPLVSLNWDINFEEVVFENSRVPMSNYYGEYLFKNLSHEEQEKGFNPVIEILKPHGSLNWHFRTNQLNRMRQKERIGDNEPIAAYGGNFGEDEYHLHIYDHIPNGPYVMDELSQSAFLIPPLPEKEVALVNTGDARDYIDNYWERKKRIEDSILKRIEAHAKKSRTLVIVGYSFPVEDEHIRKLFVNNQFENVWVLDTSEEVFRRIAGYFPKAESVFKKDGFADIMNWDVGEGFKPSLSE